MTGIATLGFLFLFIFEIGFHCVAQTVVGLLGSSNPPVLERQAYATMPSSGILGHEHRRKQIHPEQILDTPLPSHSVRTNENFNVSDLSRLLVGCVEILGCQGKE